jgi:hypothetical protein
MEGRRGGGRMAITGQKLVADNNYVIDMGLGTFHALIVTYNSDNQTVRRYGTQFRSAEPIITRDHATIHCKFDDKY